jgi:hypothetical protein
MSSAVTALPPGVSRNDRPCWVPVMPDGTRWESEYGEPHFGTRDAVRTYIKDVVFDSIEEITKVVKSWGWTQSPAGWSCMSDCVECAEAVAAVDPSWTPVPVAADQLSLIGDTDE